MEYEEKRRIRDAFCIFLFLWFLNWALGWLPLTETEKTGRPWGDCTSGVLVLDMWCLGSTSRGICFVCFCLFAFSMAARAAYGGSQARGRIGAVAAAYTRATATRDPSCVFDLHHRSWQCRIFNPLSKARDRTHNPMVLGFVNHWATMGTLIGKCFVYLFSLCEMYPHGIYKQILTIFQVKCTKIENNI